VLEPPSTPSSVSSEESERIVNNNKRKRDEDEEVFSSKLRIEEKILPRGFVDETSVDDSEVVTLDSPSPTPSPGPSVTENAKEALTNGEADVESGEDGEEEPDYEVEDIVDYQYCRQSQAGMYLVKWVGWDSSDNTWEPAAHLECTDLLTQFYKTRLAEREAASPVEKRALELPPDPRESFQVRQDFLREHGPVLSKKTLNALFIKDQAAPSNKKAQLMSEKAINAAVDQCTRTSKPNEGRLAWLKEQLAANAMLVARQEQMRELRQFENTINKTDPYAHVSVINDVDLEGPPNTIEYINSYRAGAGITIPTDPVIGCECGPVCNIKNERTCCPSMASPHFNFAYTKYNRLRDVIGVGSPIYECNKLCSCDASCTNRVVQKGRKHKLAIFRTANGCGWGVKAMEPIKAGSFVVEYVGEMITSEEAEVRGKKYDAEGRTYLFDLDFNLGEENLYTVDAAFCGNLSRFINHSCDPNLNIFSVYINNLDPNMPQLCLFAKRDIQKFEQVTFDYCQSTGKAEADIETPLLTPSKRVQVSGSSSQKDSEVVREEELQPKTECRCGAANCRKVLF